MTIRIRMRDPRGTRCTFCAARKGKPCVVTMGPRAGEPITDYVHTPRRIHAGFHSPTHAQLPYMKGRMTSISDSPIYCEHANECPQVCPCPADCYCKTRTCAPRAAKPPPPPPEPIFTVKHMNRWFMPSKLIIVCEDDVKNQARIATHLASILQDNNGVTDHVQVNIVAGAGFGAYVAKVGRPDLVILDHDMPCGDGGEFIAWLKWANLAHVPVLTFSGIAGNNDRMKALGGDQVHVFTKEEVITGAADTIILKAVGPNRAP